MSTLLPGPVSVSVPATSANLGPGFDALGLALDHRDVVRARLREASGVEVLVTGEGEEQVALDETHLVVRSLRAGLEQLGVDSRPGLALECTNRIPHARGLGSSSAAIVAGVSLARALVDDGPARMDDAALVSLAGELEGHPDNVAPAVLGGVTVAFRDEGRFRAVRLDVDPRVAVVVFVPPEGVATSYARGLLPASVPHADAARNAGRAALMVAALTHRPDLLMAATEDRLHQRYREPAMPGSLALVATLRGRGVPAVISGGGPTVLAFTDPAGRSALLGQAPPGWAALAPRIDARGVVLSRP